MICYFGSPVEGDIRPQVLFRDIRNWFFHETIYEINVAKHKIKWRWLFSTS